MKYPPTSYCYAKLPRAGLGNMLFVWARARIFAQLNDLPFAVSSWKHFNIGTFLRRERSKRIYAGYFSGTEEWGTLKSSWMLRNYTQVIEPPVAPLACGATHKTVYIFNQIPHWDNFFRDIKPQRQFIREEFYRVLAPVHRETVECASPPIIGVHVRQGDFRPLRIGEDFAQVGAVRTPLKYFEDVINNIRQVHGSSLPVTIFSDGHDHELAPLLEMPNVVRAEKNADVGDLLLLSASRIIVTSAGSTFSYWSAFLSDSPVIMHPDHIHASLRPVEVNKRFYEGAAVGAAEAWPPLLQRNIKDIVVS